MGDIYPERPEPRLEWLDRAAATAAGFFAPWVRPRASRFQGVIDRVQAQARAAETISDAQIPGKARELGQRLRIRGYQDDEVAEAFALIRETAGRTLGMRHFDVQLLGGLALLRGMIAEMETGEGKTLVATLPACTAGMAGVPVHVITVNDYLATRDAQWMRPIYQALGLTVGTIVHGMTPDAKRAAYKCNVTYGTNKEITFDYLRDRIVLRERPSGIRLQVERLYAEQSRIRRLLLRGLHFAIVDEADSILVDEARTPLIISSEGNASEEESLFRQALGVAEELSAGEDFSLSLSDRSLELKERGKSRIEDFSWSNGGSRTTRQHREELVHQALVALHLFLRDKHYLVKEGKVQIIDEYTGRLMADRSWERGLHQLIEIKENVEMTARKETQARISYQRFFRRYLRLAGMTGTAREIAGELWSIYRLPVVSIPTNRPLSRKIYPDEVYPLAAQRWNAVVKNVSENHRSGRPVLVGTRSVAASEHLSGLLSQAELSHRVLNARQDQEEAEIISQAGEQGKITVATNMAGRGTDIRLGAGVAELGGLHVIATERHEARRIDRQLFGRCARQGDPGTVQAMVSLEDELAAAYLSRPLQWLGKKILRKAGTIWNARIGKILLHRAQRRAERLHARMRRQLLKMDEHLGDTLAFSGRPE